MNSTNINLHSCYRKQFERYVNFEFYKLTPRIDVKFDKFERYVNFEFYKPHVHVVSTKVKFERYVNFEFYKPINTVQ